MSTTTTKGPGITSADFIGLTIGIAGFISLCCIFYQLWKQNKLARFGLTPSGGLTYKEWQYQEDQRRAEAAAQDSANAQGNLNEQIELESQMPHRGSRSAPSYEEEAPPDYSGIKRPEATLSRVAS